jgi:hypothetical protein
MPFWQSASISLYLPPGATLSRLYFDANLALSPFRPTADSGAYFHATETKFSGFGPSTLLNIPAGAGHLVGMFHQYVFKGNSTVTDAAGHPPEPRCAHEGDFIAFRDHGRSPFLHSSGTEDFFGNSKGWMQSKSLPFSGVPLREAATETDIVSFVCAGSLLLGALVIFGLTLTRRCPASWLGGGALTLHDKDPATMSVGDANNDTQTLISARVLPYGIALILAALAGFLLYRAQQPADVGIFAYREDASNPFSFEDGITLQWEHGSDTGFRSSTVHRNYMDIQGQTVTHFYLNPRPGITSLSGLSLPYSVGSLLRHSAASDALTFSKTSRFGSATDATEAVLLTGVWLREAEKKAVYGLTVPMKSIQPFARFRGLLLRRTYDGCVPGQTAWVALGPPADQTANHGGPMYEVMWHTEREVPVEGSFCFLQDELVMPKRALSGLLDGGGVGHALSLDLTFKSNATFTILDLEVMVLM